MKKRLMMGLLAGGLLAAMLPGVASATPPVVETVEISCLVDGEPEVKGSEIRGSMGDVRRELGQDWYRVCDPGTVEISEFRLEG